MSISPHLSIILQLPNTFAMTAVEAWQRAIQVQLTPLIPEEKTVQWFWINPELENIPVDAIRELTHQLSFGTQPNLHQMVVILAADQAQRSAQNAVLKLIEEPPAQTTLVLATTAPDGLLPTIQSRCQVIHLESPATFSADSGNSAAHPDLATDLALLTEFSQNAAAISYSQLITLATKYKDRLSAKLLLTQWLNSLDKTLGQQPAGALELASQSLQTLQELDANINPSLSLEHLWFAWKQTH